MARGTALVATVSLDRGHVLVHDAGAAWARWQVFSIRERAIVAEVPYEEGARDSSVCGGRLLYLVKGRRPSERAGAPGTVITRLHAYDLAANRALWSFVLSEDAASHARLRQ